jgi:NhaA family Na+:H+ antiporter
MSIFIAMLAFTDERLLNAAKLGVLLGSLVAAVLGLSWGAILVHRLRRLDVAGFGQKSRASD